VAAGGADDVEIALGVYVRRVVRRWWIVLAAIVVAVAIALAGSSSSHTTYRAQTLISLGTPFTATGGAAITSAFCTSPIAPATLIKQDAVREAAERKAGLKPGQLTGHASAQAVAGAVTKLNFTPAVNIIVQGPWKGTTTAEASVALAEGVRDACSVYAERRLTTTESRLKRETKEQDTLNDRLAQAQTLLAKVQADPQLSAARPPRSPRAARAQVSVWQSCSEPSPASRWHYCHMWWLRRDAGRRNGRTGAGNRRSGLHRLACCGFART
jgi:hypothetical protein